MIKKGIILLSSRNSNILTILEENRQNEFGYVDYVIATSDKTLLLDIYHSNLGCYIYYVPNFSAVKKLVHQLNIEIIVFDAYEAEDISSEEHLALLKKEISVQHCKNNLLLLNGYAKTKHLKMFARNNCYY